ncbi:MAG: hypothetical protein WC114_12680 [Smithellaceae bacterium]|nr:hypothetical protein [Eubacteriales bacterium]
MNRTEIQKRLVFHQAALDKLQAAYLALVEGGVQSYSIDDRTLHRFDLPRLMEEIRKEERMVDELTALLGGGGRRRAYAILPRDW